MPFIDVKTSQELPATAEDRLSSELCAIARDCLGKGEAWVMCGFEGNAHLHFRSSDAGVCYVEVKAYGTLSADGTNEMTKRITALLSSEFGVSPDRIYVSYFPTPDWGWNGSNF